MRKYFHSFIYQLKINNTPIKKLDELPTIVFESDDWGMVRMPSTKVKNQIMEFYPSLKDNPYLQNDCLERSEDLEALFNLLSNRKDSFGLKPKITANFICQNPDFTKIEESGFSQYSSEPFHHSFTKFPGCEGSFALQKAGLEEQIFVPQFHGREHVNVSRWIRNLRNNKSLTKAVQFGLVSYVSDLQKKSPCISQFLDAMNAENIDDLDLIIRYSIEGLSMFRDTWGFLSETMIAPCYFWHPLLEDAVSGAGVKAFQGIRIQKVPLLQNDPYRYAKMKRKMGDKNKNGQFYLVRNSFFEPSTDLNQDWVSSCLKEISVAIKKCGIAIVSLHRVNFMGGIDIANRDRNLKLMGKLFDGIEKMLPNFSYSSSCDILARVGAINEVN